MKDCDYITWEKRHPILSSIANGCYALICLMLAMLAVYFTVYVILAIKEERELLEILAERLGL